MTILGYVLLGLTIGVVSGTLGIGGGVLLVPALIWLFGFDPPRAAGTTLGVLALPVCVFAAWEHHRCGRLDLEAALWIGIAFALGGYGGAKLMPYLHVSGLRLCFGLMLVYIGMRFLVTSDSQVVTAVVGLIGVGAAWLGYWALQALGRRYLARPQLAEKILQAHEQGRGELDYHI